MVFGDRIKATRDKEPRVPLNDDVNAVSDSEYTALLDAVEPDAVPCPAAVPPHVVAAAVARLDESADYRGE